MYVSVQKIYGKSKVYGYAKDVVTTTLNTGTTCLLYTSDAADD